MVRQIPASLTVACDPKNPITLVGPPSNLSGTVRVRHNEEQWFMLTGGTLTCSQPGSTDEIECAVRMLARVFPRQLTEVRISASLPSWFAPGPCDGVLAVGATTYPVKLQVSEDFDVDVAPAQFYLPNIAGRFYKIGHVSNNGNVPITLGSVGAISLDKKNADCAIVRSALSDVPADVTTVNDWVTLYLRAAGTHLKHIGMLWVGVVGAPVQVGPGETVPVEFEFRVPDELPHGSYTAVVDIGNSAFEVIIVPGFHDVVKEPAAARGDAVKVRRSR